MGGGKRLVARSATSLLGGPTHVHLALVRGNTAVKVVLDHNASSLLMLGQRWKSVPLNKVMMVAKMKDNSNPNLIVISENPCRLFWDGEAATVGVAVYLAAWVGFR